MFVCKCCGLTVRVRKDFIKCYYFAISIHFTITHTHSTQRGGSFNLRLRCLFVYCTIYCLLLFIVFDSILLLIVESLSKLKHNRTEILCSIIAYSGKAEIISLKSMTWFFERVLLAFLGTLFFLLVHRFCFVRWIRCHRWLLFQLDKIFIRFTQPSSERNLRSWPKMKYPHIRILKHWDRPSVYWALDWLSLM